MSAPLPRSDPYVDTLLLECGRPNSEELKADPTNKTHAIFTNKLGNGVKLNVGDKISVSSAFVSDRGCGGSVIEFKGVPVPGETYDLTETTVVKSQLPRFNGTQIGDLPAQTQYPDNPAPFPDIGPMNCHKVNHKQTTKTFQLQDNEVSYEQTFYKTTNGQGYFHLPRRWDFTYPHGQAQEVGTGGLAVAKSIPESCITRDPYEKTPEALGQALPSTDMTTYDCAKNGRACISPDVRKCCPADWYLYPGTNSYSEALNEAGDGGNAVNPAVYYVPGAETNEYLQSYVPRGNPMGGGQWQFSNKVLEVIYRQIENDDFAEDDFIMKQKNDNSRYTIYAKDVCHYAEHIADIPNTNPNTEMPKPLYEMPENLTYPDADDDPIEHASRDDFLGTNADDDFEVSGAKEPSLSGYTKYQEIKTLTVPKGYNSPSNVAETITNQLNATKNQRTIRGFAGPMYGPSTLTPDLTSFRPGATPQTPGTWTQQGLDQRVGNQLTDFASFMDGTANNDSNQGSTLNTTQRQIAVSTILESETLKSFACANMESYSKKNFVQYRGQDPETLSALKYVTVTSNLVSVEGFDYPDKASPKDFLNVDGTLIDGTEQYGVIAPAGADKGIETKPVAVGNIQYMSAHQYIGVKRPDLFDAFRDFYSDQILGQEGTHYSWRNLNSPQCLSGIPALYSADCPFITTTEWTDDNLQRYATVFDAQAKYTELFDGYAFSNIEQNNSAYKTSEGGKGVSSDHMRFLHMNSYYGDYPIIDKVLITSAGVRTESQSEIYTSVSGRQQLGDDNINTPLRPRSSHTGTAGYLDASRNAVDFSSHPMFVWYDETSKDNTENDGSRNVGDLAYGCMFKFTVPLVGNIAPVMGATENDAGVTFFLDDETIDAIRTAYGRTVSFIGFKTREIGGLPTQLFTNKATDWHTFGGLTMGKGIPRPSRIKITSVASVLKDHSGSGCGFDIHFNAYGTSVIGLYSGYLAGDKYAVSSLKTGCDLPVGVTGEYYYDRGMGENAIIPADKNPVTAYTSTLDTTKSKKNTTMIPIDNELASSLVGTLIVPDVTGAVGAQWRDYPKNDDGTPKILKIVKVGHTDDTAFVQISQPLSWSLAGGAVALPDLNGLTSVTFKTFGATCISKFIKERYVGANQPLLNFDDKGERFNFQQLHTPIYVGNEANSGDGLTAVSTTAGEQVLEINRRLLGNDFTPEMMPYQTPILHDGSAHRGKGPSGEGVEDDAPPIQAMNTNLIPWQIYDSDGGVFMEGFGINADQWEKSLWGVLGFSYDQFHPTTSTFNRQTRINNTISTDGSVFTTNANLEASDIVKFRGNRYGSSLFTNQPPVASVNGSYATALFQTEADYPVISIVQTSAQVSAENLPRKMLRPFFLVKSNILGDMNYYGGGDSGINLPIVCVVNKENGFGDFYFQKGFDLEFTVTIPKVLTSITTSIHDPDMRLSTISENSGIIYKITKMNHANLDVVQDVLQTQQTTMMRHSEMLRIAQEEAIREQVRNGDQAGIGGGTLETVADPRDGSATDPNVPVEPGGADAIRQRMANIRGDPTFVNPGQVSAGQFESAVAGLRQAMAQNPATGFAVGGQNPVFGSSTIPAQADGQGVPIPVLEEVVTDTPPIPPPGEAPTYNADADFDAPDSPTPDRTAVAGGVPHMVAQMEQKLKTLLAHHQRPGQTPAQMERAGQQMEMLQSLLDMAGGARESHEAVDRGEKPDPKAYKEAEKKSEAIRKRVREREAKEKTGGAKGPEPESER